MYMDGVASLVNILKITPKRLCDHAKVYGRIYLIIKANLTYVPFAICPVCSYDLAAIMLEAFELARWHVVQLERSVFSELLDARIMSRKFEQHVVQTGLV